MNDLEPTVSVLIVSYNTCQMTLACLVSLFSQPSLAGLEVIVVDNQSTDGSADAIAARFPAVKVIQAGENLGFARANNLAARHASGGYLLLLNPDTLVLDDAVAKLLAFARGTAVARLWGGRTVFADGSLNPASCWRFMSLWTLTAGALGLSSLFPASAVFNSEAYGGWRRDSTREVDMVVGCFLLIERRLWQDLGGFDERFFMYAEEADLCYRARQRGARPLFTPAATIVHYGGASETARAAKIIRLFTGKATFLHKHWRGWKAGLGVAIIKLNVGIRALGYGLAGRFTGQQRHRQAAAEWWQVWKARKSWAAGYPECRATGSL